MNSLKQAEVDYLMHLYREMEKWLGLFQNSLPGEIAPKDDALEQPAKDNAGDASASVCL